MDYPIEDSCRHFHDHRDQLEKEGIDCYPHLFQRSHLASELHTNYENLPAGSEQSEAIVTIAGRIRAIRNSGMFVDIHDPSGKLQVFVEQAKLEDTESILVNNCSDIGDIIGVSGWMRRTPRGELTVNAQKIRMLAKALRPLPEKYHGFADIESRYRQRSVDFIVNQESRDAILKRAHITAALRRTLENDKFVEVETPLLHPILGGASAKPFVTRHNALEADFFLRIAPELYLKRLVVGGIEKVFEIGRNFRNEGLSVKHNPEFTALEVYQGYADYNDMMALSERLIEAAARAANGTTEIEIDGQTVSLAGPFPRVRMTELVNKKVDVNFETICGNEEARNITRGLGCDLQGHETWGQCVEVVFSRFVEPDLVFPIHVTDFPRDISPLAKRHRLDHRFAERFETFVGRMEIANAFSELTDPLDQFDRFTHQMAQRESGDEEAQMMDMDYVRALEQGLPPCGGLGIGVDRLAMLLVGVSTIKNVIAFPTLRPIV